MFRFLKQYWTFIWNTEERQTNPRSLRKKIEDGLIEHKYDRSTVRKISVEKSGQ